MKAGDTAPDFSLADDTGTTRTLSGLLAEGPVVLFFYPLASSGGCTQESCHFRDLAGEFAAVGAQRVGISADSVEKQHTFSVNNSFDYPLLSDPKGVVAKQFDAKRSWLPALPVKRKTFVIDTDRTVLEVITGEMRFDEHADSALAVLRTRAESA
jgi:thioredoxin-dependent peroxiredoxin